MDLFRMQCFVAVAECRNLSRAAEKVQITQPAMSVQMRETEKEIGCPLLVRGHHSLELTPAGESLYRGFCRILELYAGVRENARAISREGEHLALGYHGPLGWAGLPAFLAAFSKKHPDIRLSLFQQQWGELVQGLLIGSLDVAFLNPAELEANPQLEGFLLFEEKACFAMSPHHPLAGRKSVTLEDIKNETVLMNGAPSVGLQKTREELVASGVRHEQLCMVPQMDMTMVMAAAEQGIAALPRSFRLENPALRFVDYESDAICNCHCLAWNRGSFSHPMKEFVAECKKTSWPYAPAR